MADIHVPVLIVGGGLAGLTSAVMLGWRGVRPMLIERHSDMSKNLRARGVNFRTRELLRVAGLEADLMAQGDDMKDFSIVIAESVTGRELRTILPRGSFDTTSLSPAAMSHIGQDRVEPILRRHAVALGAEVRYATELVDFDHDDAGVTASIRDLLRTGAHSQIRADCLIAADGHRSRIRECLGVGCHGIGSLSHNIAIVFEADLEGALPGRHQALYYLQNPNFTGAFISAGQHNRAFVTVEYDPDCETAAAFDDARCARLVRAALGIEHLDIRILEISPWEMSSRIADRFADGRVFLVGDAAHTMPPTGGLGGQTAVQDAYDIAWKLAMVLQDHAGRELLETYARERQPVSELTVTLQTANYAQRMRPDRVDLRPTGSPLNYADVAFGYRYRSDCIVQDTADDGAMTENPNHPSGCPGTRGGHIWFEYRGRRLSSIDLIGREFLLLSGSDAAAWARAATSVSFQCKAPLRVYRVGSDLIDVDQRWTAVYGVTRAGAVLLRPDGHIAWRARGAVYSPLLALREALARILCRTLESLSTATSPRDGLGAVG